MARRREVDQGQGEQDTRRAEILFPASVCLGWIQGLKRLSQQGQPTLCCLLSCLRHTSEMPGVPGVTLYHAGLPCVETEVYTDGSHPSTLVGQGPAVWHSIGARCSGLACRASRPPWVTAAFQSGAPGASGSDPRATSDSNLVLWTERVRGRRERRYSRGREDLGSRVTPIIAMVQLSSEGHL